MMDILSTARGSLVLALVSGSALAQPSAPPTSTDQVVRRFPQPVRVGDLLEHRVLGPSEDQPVLGRVAAISRRRDGGASVLVRTGGWLGFGAHLVAVPVEAVGLLGEHVALLDITAEQLRALPALDVASAPAVAPDEVIRVGLAKPFH